MDDKNNYLGGYLYSVICRACPKFWQSLGALQAQQACISGDMCESQLAYHDLVHGGEIDSKGDVR